MCDGERLWNSEVESLIQPPEVYRLPTPASVAVESLHLPPGDDAILQFQSFLWKLKLYSEFFMITLLRASALPKRFLFGMHPQTHIGMQHEYGTLHLVHEYFLTLCPELKQGGSASHTAQLQ